MLTSTNRVTSSVNSFSHDQVSSAPDAARVKTAYRALGKVTKTDAKERIATRLMDEGFDVNGVLHEENGQKITLLDLAISQDDDKFMQFLIQDKRADPRFCNENSKSFPRRMERVQVLSDEANALNSESQYAQLETDATAQINALIATQTIPPTSGSATPGDQIKENMIFASACKLGHCLGDIAKIPAKMLAFTVGSLMCGLATAVNAALPWMIYLPFVALVPIAWTVGYAIDKFSKNDKLYVTQGLGECAASPAYAVNAILAPVRGALGLVSLSGEKLMDVGYENKEFHEKLMNAIKCSVSDLTEHGHTPLDLSYEKIVGQRAPSFVGEYLGCSMPVVLKSVKQDLFGTSHLTDSSSNFSNHRRFPNEDGVSPDVQAKVEHLTKKKDELNAQVRAEAKAEERKRIEEKERIEKQRIEDARVNAYLSSMIW